MSYFDLVFAFMLVIKSGFGDLPCTVRTMSQGMQMIKPIVRAKLTNIIPATRSIKYFTGATTIQYHNPFGFLTTTFWPERLGRPPIVPLAMRAGMLIMTTLYQIRRVYGE